MRGRHAARQRRAWQPDGAHAGGNPRTSAPRNAPACTKCRSCRSKCRIPTRSQRCLSASCSFAQITTTTATSFNDIGLTAGTGYSYRVRATDAANNLGPYSNTATATIRLLSQPRRTRKAGKLMIEFTCHAMELPGAAFLSEC